MRYYNHKCFTEFPMVDEVIITGCATIQINLVHFVINIVWNFDKDVPPVLCE